MDSLELIKNIAPEIIDIIEKRYLILRSVFYNEPIGRRSLSVDLGFKERTIRDEANILKQQGLLNIELMGMYITEDGKELLESLHLVYSKLKGLPQLEEKLSKALGIKKVIILPGSSAENSMVLRDMGKITSKVLREITNPKDIIGITGGSTMAVVAEETIQEKKARDITVIPARGGLGREVENQSNSIAAKLGQRLGGSYRLLYVPDGLEEEALGLILKNEEVKESMEMINNMNTLLLGIGRADIMAQRRNLSEKRIEELTREGAVAEALGHYFDIEGREVWEYKTVGLSLDKFKELENVIGVAGGEDKAEAIIAVSTLNKNMTLVIDEAAANKIFKIVKDATR